MTYVIAEIGFNHGGDVNLALAMVDAAAKGGVDAVKFQSFRAEDLYFPGCPEYAIFKAGELSEEGLRRLKERCDALTLDFISTPFSLRWVSFLADLGAAKLKIASMDLNNRLLIEAAAKTGLPLIISTGGGDLDEMVQAERWAIEAGCDDLTMLHCISNYPTKPEEVSLSMMAAMRQRLKSPVGFSDHTLGAKSAIEATQRGAVLIEKHFTSDKNLPGPDNAIAADPAEMATLVAGVREATEEVFSDDAPLPVVRPDDTKRPVMRRGIYAARPIAAGETLTLDNLALVRPEVTPLEALDVIVGSPSVRSYERGEPIT